MGVGLAWQPGGLALCRARVRRGRVEVSAGVAAPLPAGALVPGLGRPNLADLAACDAALGELLARGGVSRAAAALAIPDASARVRVLPDAPRGGTPADARRVVAWQLRDALPFPPERARVDVAACPGGALCLVADDSVVSQYETLARAHRLVPGHVEPASLALWRLLETGESTPPSGRLAVLVVEGSATLVASAAETPRVWRLLSTDDPGAVAREAGDTLHALREAGLLGGHPRLLLHAPDSARDPLAAALETETGLSAQPPAWPAGVPADPVLLPALGAALAA